MHTAGQIFVDDRRAHPIALDERGHLWGILAGNVDVFAIERSGGTRHHLWSAGPGDLLPAAPPLPGAPFVITAVAVGPTRLRRVSFAELRDEIPPAALDRLVVVLTALLGSGSQLALHEMVVPGGELVLSRGRRAGIRDRTLWVRARDGAAQIGARPELLLSATAGRVPLHGTWVTAVSEAARIDAVETAELFASGGDASGLATLVDFVQASVADRIAAEEMALSARLHARAVSDRRIWENALGRLAGAVEGEQVDPGDSGRTAGVASAGAGSDYDLLIGACHLIGDAAGIAFREPPRWEVERSPELLPAICRVSRIRSRRVALRGDWWARAAGPLLGRLGEERIPVALLPDRDGTAMVDPRSGTATRITADVAAQLQPFAVMFYRPLPEDARRIRDLFTFALPVVRTDLARVAAAALTSAALALALPLSMAHVFNQVIPGGETSRLITLLLALIAAAVATASFDVSRALAMTRVEGRVSAALQAAIVDRLLSLPVPFFRRFAVGDLTQRAAAIQAMQEVVGTSTLTVVFGSVFAVVNVGLMLAFDWRLALVGTGLLGAASAAHFLLVRQALRHERRQQEKQMRVAGLEFAMISGMTRLRVAAAEARAFAVWSGAYSRQRESAHRAGAFKAALAVFNDVLPIAATAILFAAAGRFAFGSGAALRTGDFVAFYASFAALFAAAVALSNTAANVAPAAAILEKVRPIVETSPEVTQAKNDPGELQGKIEAVQVKFRYESDGPLILDDVSFSIDPGQFVAFVGPSGSGKSTTLRLLLGFDAPESGAIYYDGQDLASLDVSAIRNRQLGVVRQDTRLLAGDIFTNIVGASSTLTLDDAWEAADAAGLADDIREMPMGMHTVIVEGGATFSGGQRQRLMIARALVRKPRIVFFDEATSALDNPTQAKVTRTLELLSATRIVIAHRLSTIRSADRIFVMDKGRIAESGSFDELAAAGGLFSRLIARQQAT